MKIEIDIFIRQQTDRSVRLPEKKKTATSFEDAYPNIAYWTDVQGWIEIGPDDFSRSLVRCLDPGGMVWESDDGHRTADQALCALEEALEELLKEYGL